MPVRSPKNSATGTSGESFVRAEFEEMGWGAADIPGGHDVGTDFWFHARDSRGFDLGALIGAQVKSGPSWFEEPEYGNGGELLGWWYRDYKHKDYWCDHSVSHILVLRDMESKIAYWASLTHDRFESTGKGYKILVSSSSIVNEEHNDDLIKLAVGDTRNPNWEGSAWTVGETVSDNARLRYALITPRVIAPHRNSGTRDYTPCQAIAVLMQLRLANLNRRQDGINILDHSLLEHSPSWQWRFYSCLYDWIVNGNSKSILECVDSAVTAEQRMAAIVCVALIRFEESNIDEAIRILRKEIERDEAGPVDQAWLLVHLSQCEYEIGNIKESSELALLAYKIRNEVNSDPTAQAIAASASNLIFFAHESDDEEAEQVKEPDGDELQPAIEDDVKKYEHAIKSSDDKLVEAIKTNDTLSSWWRSQALLRGFERQLDELFDQWAGANNKTRYTADEAWCSFRSVMLQAGMSANWTSWARAACLLARRTLMLECSTSEVASALQLLVRSGSRKELEKALKRLMRKGPVSPIISISAKLDLNSATKMSLLSSIIFVRTSVDVLAMEDCNRHLRWAVLALKDEGEYEYDTLDMLHGLVDHCDADSRRDVIKYLIELPAVDDLIRARRLGSVVSEIPLVDWTESDINAIRSRELDSIELKDAFESLLAAKEPLFREGLVDRIKAGDKSALGSYGRIVDLPSDAAAEMIEHISVLVENQISSANNGQQAIDNGQDLSNLVILNLWHPDVSDWPTVVAALESKLLPSRKVKAIRILGSQAEMVPEDIRNTLRQALSEASQNTPVEEHLGNVDDLQGTAQFALDKFFPDEVKVSDLVKRMGGTKEDKRSAALQAFIDRSDGTPTDLAVLVSSARDISEMVSRTAIAGLATWVVRGKAMPDTFEILKNIVREGGPQTGLWASLAFNNAKVDARSARLLAEFLIAHPSAIVRYRVGHFVNGVR